MEEPSIRAAVRADAARLMELHRALHIEHRSLVVPPELRPLHAFRDFDELLELDMQAMLQDPATEIFVAETNDGLAGYATGRVVAERQRVLSPKGVVEDWYVTPAMRSRGLGRALLEALERRFRQRGCRMVESSTLAGNVRSRELHERMGFQEVEVRYRKKIT